MTTKRNLKINELAQAEFDELKAKAAEGIKAKKEAADAAAERAAKGWDRAGIVADQPKPEVKPLPKKEAKEVVKEDAGSIEGLDL